MTDTPRRVIKIKLSARDAADSPELLKNVEAAFQHDDLDIDMRDIESVKIPVSQEALDATSDALDLNDQLIKQEMKTVPTPTEAESKTRDWVKKLRNAGIRATATALMKAVFSKVLDTFTG